MNKASKKQKQLRNITDRENAKSNLLISLIDNGSLDNIINGRINIGILRTKSAIAND
ncbi:MAG: hypothetical protein P8I52_03915 [Flavobacteriales bacterium]|nr:hypothetical protein [Flavobacteriales bacterium]